MAKAIVTQERVNEIAALLVERGDEPSIINVQAEIGGGSYSTIKRYLDVWRTERTSTPPIEAPAEVQEKAADLARAVWATAIDQANQRVEAAQARAADEVASARAELAQAEAMIARHEVAAEQQAQQIAAHKIEIEQLRADLEQSRKAAAQSDARAVVAEVRATELTQRIDDLKAELAEAHRQIEALGTRAALSDSARLADELAAIKRQLEDQATTIAQLSNPTEAPPKRRGGRKQITVEIPDDAQ